MSRADRRPIVLEKAPLMSRTSLVGPARIVAPRPVAVVLLVAMVMAVVQVFSIAPAHAATVWTASFLPGSIGDGFTIEDADGDWVVGSRGNGSFGYNVRTGESREFALPGMSMSGPTGISGNRVVGWMMYDGGRQEPYLYDLSTAEGRSLESELGFKSRALDISGTKVIATTDFDIAPMKDFVYDLSNRSKTAIPDLPWMGRSIPSAIDGNTVVGSTWPGYTNYDHPPHAFSFNVASNSITDLGTLPWYASSTATDVSDGMVVGRSATGGWDSRQDGFYGSTAGGQMAKIPDVNGEAATWANAVSSKWVVGHAYIAPWVMDRATKTVSALPSPAGVRHVRPQAVVGDVIFGDSYSDADGKFHAVMWRASKAVDAATPTISGSVRVGSTVTATSGAWGPTGVALTYQWYLNGTAVIGATNRTFAVRAADLGKGLKVKVTGSAPGHQSVSRTSASSTVAPGTLSGRTPTISGTTKVGSTLRVYRGTWSPPGVALTQRWYRDGTAISGATSTSYKLTSSDRGKRITVKVTGRKTGYTSKVVASTSTKAVAYGTLSSATPRITGTTKVGQRLTVSRGIWSPSDVALTQRWYRNGTAISGATSTSYKLTSADRGKRVTVKVTGRKTGYTSKVVTSASTAAIR